MTFAKNTLEKTKYNFEPKRQSPYYPFLHSLLF